MAENEIRVPCDLDKESVEFLESKLGAKINPHLETETDYYRAVFYFKCCGLQEESGTKDPNNQDFKINDCFSSKEKADILFENVYREALKLNNFIERLSTGEDLFSDPYFNASMAAHAATINEHLTPKLHIEDSDKRDNGNAQLMRTVSLDAIYPFLNAFPDLQTEMGEQYNRMCQCTSEQIDAFLPKDADMAAYDAVIREHPKAVFALVLSAKDELKIASPEDLLQKSQQPEVIAISDNISFEHDWASHIYSAKEAMFEFGKVAATRELADSNEVMALCVQDPVLAMASLVQKPHKDQKIESAQEMRDMMQNPKNVELARELTNAQCKSYNQISDYIAQKIISNTNDGAEK